MQRKQARRRGDMRDQCCMCVCDLTVGRRDGPFIKREELSYRDAPGGAQIMQGERFMRMLRIIIISHYFDL